MIRQARRIVPLKLGKLYHKHYLCQVITGKNFLSSKIPAAESCKPAEERTKTPQTGSLDQPKIAVPTGRLMRRRSLTHFGCADSIDI